MRKNNLFVAFAVLVFLSNNLNASCYCYVPCINTDGGGSMQGNNIFSRMVDKETSKINQTIRKTIEEMDKINKAQAEKIYSTASMEAKYSKLLLEKEKQSEVREKEKNLKCLNLDFVLENISNKITLLEQSIKNIK